MGSEHRLSETVTGIRGSHRLTRLASQASQKDHATARYIAVPPPASSLPMDGISMDEDRGGELYVEVSVLRQ